MNVTTSLYRVLAPHLLTSSHHIFRIIMLQIEPIAAFSDNYIWLLSDPETSRAVVVDPGDAEPVEQVLAARGLKLESILITHHHGDHIGGVDQLLAQRTIPVLGPVSENIPQITQPLKHGDRCNALGIEFEIIAVPGHTLDHIAYYSAQNPEQPLLFCGDTLFAGGCGRIFEGDPEMMYHSLQRLANLPERTQVYCAHEYTLANLAFAQAVEPDNQALQQRVASAKTDRAAGIPTVPSSLALEQATNPFLRCHLSSVKRAAAQNGEVGADYWQVFAKVRHWKDNF